MKRFKDLGLLLLFTFILAAFCYFRLKPIYFQTIPYTYDQGRDFLKAQEIIKDKNLQFIGPTTGIQGIFHGAWWYYFLAIPYFLLGGHPATFSLFIFLVFLGSVIAFSVFLKKNFNMITAVFFFTAAALSPYFIFSSIFAINSAGTMPFILLLFYSVYKYLQDKKELHLFLVFMSLGFILEFEVPFGLFIIPAFILTVLITRNLKVFFGKGRNIAAALLGLLIPLSLRILFEVKNGFPQSKIALKFLTDLNNAKPVSLREVFLERLNLFESFYLSMIPGRNIYLALFFVITTLIGLFLAFKSKKSIQKNYALVMTILPLGLFGLSLFYRRVFWSNYFEGLPLFFLLLVTLGLYNISKLENRVLHSIPVLALTVFLSVGLYSLRNDTGRPTEIYGMRVQTLAVEKIYQNEGENEFCVKVYTPPVIPYTYDYLFDYHSRSGKQKGSQEGFVKHKCWLVLEKDHCQFKEIEVREKKECEDKMVNWKANALPRESRLLKKENINSQVSIELWQRKN